MPSASQISQDAALMLKRLGLKSPDELFASVPANIRYPKLDLDDPLSELEALGEARSLAARNANPDALAWFLGAGQYRHFIPSLVESLSERFAGLAGSPSAAGECRDLIAGLCGMETASLRAPGGAEALAEAVLAALGADGFTRPRVLLPRKLPPECLRLLESRLGPLGVELALYRDSPREAAKGLDRRSACLVVADPDFSGEMFDLSGVAARVHDAGSLLIVLFDPIMLGLFKTPGEYGADFAVAEGQSLGSHMGRRGSCFGIIASGRDRAGLLPGPPAAGDARGGLLPGADPCPERSLAALRAAFYLCAMGKLGLRKAAELCWHKAHYLAARISLLPGCSIENRLFFKEFTVRLPVPAQDASSSLARAGFVPGLSLSSLYPERSNELLVAVTEMNPRAQLDAFAAAIKECL